MRTLLPIVVENLTQNLDFTTKAYDPFKTIAGSVNSAGFSASAVSAAASIAKSLEFTTKAYDPFKNIAGLLNSNGISARAVSAAASIAQSLQFATKADDPFKNITKLVNSAGISAGAVSAAASIAKSLEFTTKSYDPFKNIAELVNSAGISAGAVSAAASIAQSLQFATKADDPFKNITKLVNSAGISAGAVSAAANLAKSLEFATKAYEPLMGSIASRIDMSSLANEVSRNFNLTEFKSIADVSALSRFLVGEQYLRDLLADLDSDSFEASIQSELDRSDSPLRDENGDTLSLALAAESGVYFLALLIFAYFLLPSVVAICVITAKEFAELGVATLEHANDISKVPVVGGALAITGAGTVVAGIRNAAKNRFSHESRHEEPDDTSNNF
jgi:tRNA isopentenyl-2-thiomethyl-A-37 hydroxylase MiaE